VSKRRTWRKSHLGIDVNTQQIVSVSLTGNNEDDAAVAGRMTEGKQELLGSFRGDGAYDDFAFRQKLGPGVVQIIPPPKKITVATKSYKSAYARTCPLPRTTHFSVTSFSKAKGPRAWSFWVEIPISAPKANTPPSVKRVEALA